MFQPATLCYVRREGRTLMLHRIRKQGDVHAGKYNGLGGKFNPGESPEDCVIREVREESGLQIIDPDLRGVISFPQFSHQKDWIVFLFLAHNFTGSLLPDSEVREGVLTWVPDDQVLGLPLWPGDRIFIPWLSLNERFSARFDYDNGIFRRYQVTFYGETIRHESAEIPH